MDNTPEKGRKLAGLGIGIGAGGFGLDFGLQYFEPDLIEFIPEDQRLVYILVTKAFDLIPIVMELTGAVLFAYGALQSDQDEPVQ